jgi:outer membrane receptor protein involved in Fe transport
MPEEVVPGLEFAFAAFVAIGTPLEVGPVAAGRRRIIPIIGGSVVGPRLNGSVLPGGADWQVVLPDGTAQLVARYTLQADDGTLISVVNRGVRAGTPEVLARLAAGEAVDPSQYYFRATPSFEVAAGPHDWLMRRVFVATGQRMPDQVVIRVFAVG